MFFAHQKLIARGYWDDNAGDTGGNGSRSQDQNNKDGGQNNNSKDQHNDEDNIVGFDSLWHNDSTDTGKDGGNKDQNQNVNQNGNQGGNDPNQVLNDYINGLELNKGIDPAKIQQDLQNGDTESFNKAFEQLGSNVYRQAMMDANRMMQSKIDEAVNTAVEKATAVTSHSSAVSKMQDTLTFTKDPNIAPVAESVLQQLLAKGNSLDTAIKGVNKFFSSTAKAMGYDQKKTSGRPGRGNFGNGNGVTTEDASNDNNQSMDFVGLLTGKNS